MLYNGKYNYYISKLPKIIQYAYGSIFEYECGFNFEYLSIQKYQVFKCHLM